MCDAELAASELEQINVGHSPQWVVSAGKRKRAQCESCWGGVCVEQAPGRSGEVFAVEDVAHAGVVEHCSEGLGNQRCNGEHFDIRQLLLGRKRQ